MSRRPHRTTRRVHALRAGAALALAFALAATGVPAHASSAAPLLDTAPVVADTAVLSAAPSTLAALPVRTLNTNGAWCWFQDARAAFTADGHLLVGSTASATGTGGAARTGAVEIATVDPSDGSVERTDRLHGAGQYRPDDHSAPAVIELPDGRVVTAWTGHNDDAYVRSATLDPGDAAWTLNSPSQRSTVVTYSNLVWSPGDAGGAGVLYDFYRSGQTGVNVLTSADRGRSWSYAGTLVSNPPYYPYTKFASDGNKRIWFISTQANPQAQPGTGVRSGYLEDGVVHAADGTAVGTLAGGGAAWNSLTLVKDGSGTVEGTDTDVWTSDLVVGPAGPVAALTVKYPRNPNVAGKQYDQEYWYATWTGTAWTSHRIAFGGSELYAGQPSYTGNLSIDRTDPSHVFLSANVDPADGSELRSTADGLSHWEIYDATTADEGLTWTLSAVTSNSATDNLRPIHVTGHGRRALLWMRGSYPDFYTFDTDIVGVFEGTPTAAPQSVGTRLARVRSTVGGDWTGSGRDGLFVVGDDPRSSGFVLPAGRDERRAFIHVPLSGTYEPRRVDLNGDGRDEAVLIDKTLGRSGATLRHKVVSLDADLGVRMVSYAIPDGATPVYGDVNGDGRTDNVWYRPGPGTDYLRVSTGATGFTTSVIGVSGLYRPAVGDVDADGRDDILWHAPGSATDYIWRFTASGRVQTAFQVGGSYRPLIVDLDGNGREDILWQSGWASAPSYRWLFRSIGFPSYVSQSSPAMTTLATDGDFDGDQRADLFFNRQGDLPDVWRWSAQP